MNSVCSVSPVVSSNCTVSCSTKRNCSLAASVDSGLASQPVTEVSEGISNATDNKGYLNYEILINKLGRYGIKETVFEFRFCLKKTQNSLRVGTRGHCAFFANDTVIWGGGVRIYSNAWPQSEHTLKNSNNLCI